MAAFPADEFAEADDLNPREDYEPFYLLCALQLGSPLGGGNGGGVRTVLPQFHALHDQFFGAIKTNQQAYAAGLTRLPSRSPTAAIQYIVWYEASRLEFKQT